MSYKLLISIISLIGTMFITYTWIYLQVHNNIIQKDKNINVNMVRILIRINEIFYCVSLIWGILLITFTIIPNYQDAIGNSVFAGFSIFVFIYGITLGIPNLKIVLGTTPKDNQL